MLSDRSVETAPGREPQAPVLVPFCFWWLLPQQSDPYRPGPDPAALIGAICDHLASLGCSPAEPLRWAITAVDPLRGLQLEGVGLRLTRDFPLQP